jgi:hypothetical protein
MLSRDFSESLRKPHLNEQNCDTAGRAATARLLPQNQGDGFDLLVENAAV